MEFFLNIICNGFFAGFASFGFAVVFNVPKKTLKFCAFGGAITYNIKYSLLYLGLNIESSTFIASTIIGLVTLYWSRKYLIPRPAYTVASIIPILPGTFAFSAMINLVDMTTNNITIELFELFLYNALKAISLLGAITFGLALTSVYFIRFNKPSI